MEEEAVSIRERVEEAWVEELLARQGLTVTFIFDQPCVRDRALTPHPARAYWDAKGTAEKLYEVLLERIDFNRLVIESKSATLAYDDEATEDFWEHATSIGKGLKAALMTYDTFPNYERLAEKL